MSWRRFGFVAVVALGGILASCQTLGDRAALPPLDESREPAPPLHIRQLMQAPDGATASWDAFRGKVVVLEFWATWCAPCVAAIPHLNELADAFADEPVVFLAITDEESEPVEQFLGRREMKSWIGFDENGKTHAAYGVSGIPHTVIVDQHGRIAAVTYPTQVTEEVIRNVLEGRDTGLTTSGENRPTVAAGRDPAASDDEVPLLQAVVRKREGSGASSWGNGGFTADGMPIGQVIPAAYSISKTRIEGLEHFGEEKYTIVIQAPRRDSALMRSLLRSALEGAFEFTTHREPRRRLVYELRLPVEGEHRLLPSAMEGGHAYRTGSHVIEATNTQVSMIAPSLEFILEQPVIIEAEIEGRFDITLRFDEGVRSMPGDERASHIASAIREQLGLELVPVEREIEVLVVVPTNGDKVSNQ